MIITPSAVKAIVFIMTNYARALKGNLVLIPIMCAALSLTTSACLKLSVIYQLTVTLMILVIVHLGKYAARLLTINVLMKKNANVNLLMMDSNGVKLTTNVV